MQIGQLPSAKQEKRKGFYRSTTLVLIAFSVAFYARIFCSITHAPSALVHLHFLVVPLTCAIITSTTRTRDRIQISLAWLILAGLTTLLGVMTASAILNDAGVVNVFFDFLMLGGPFLLLLSMVVIPISFSRLERLKRWLIISSFANMTLAFIQWPLLKTGRISAGGLDETDGMAGVFFVSGAGNYVSTTVSVYFALYLLTSVKEFPKWIKYATLLGALFQLQLSDSKQVLFALFLGWLLLILLNLKDIRKTIFYTITLVVLVIVFFWCVENLEAFAAFKNYLGKDGAYGPNGAATLIKTASFRIIPEFYHSPLNWLLGLGPGHTVGRLGGWLIRENWKILGPLGATIHPASDAVLQAYFSSWIALESTMFCPLFGWAGIWGDLGFLGLGAYLYLAFLVWRYLCVDDFSKFLLLSTASFGFIFTQMEEPGFMLYTAFLLALRWQENHTEKILAL